MQYISSKCGVGGELPGAASAAARQGGTGSCRSRRLAPSPQSSQLACAGCFDHNKSPIGATGSLPAVSPPPGPRLQAPFQGLRRNGPLRGLRCRRRARGRASKLTLCQGVEKGTWRSGPGALCRGSTRAGTGGACGRRGSQCVQRWIVCAPAAAAVAPPATAARPGAPTTCRLLLVP